MRDRDKRRLGTLPPGSEHRFAPVIQTYSGLVFDFINPAEADVSITDIAHSLALINRFNGHTRRPYSVAEHCVRGSQLIDQKCAFHFLMHDAAEAYVGDVAAPLKQLLEL